jgi:hypothetical protein
MKSSDPDDKDNFLEFNEMGQDSVEVHHKETCTEYDLIRTVMQDAEIQTDLHILRHK